MKKLRLSKNSMRSGSPVKKRNKTKNKRPEWKYRSNLGRRLSTVSVEGSAVDQHVTSAFAITSSPLRRGIILFFPESRRFPRPLPAGAAITIVYLVLGVVVVVYNTWEWEGSRKSVGHTVAVPTPEFELRHEHVRNISFQGSTCCVVEPIPQQRIAFIRKADEPWRQQWLLCSCESSLGLRYTHRCKDWRPRTGRSRKRHLSTATT